MKWLDYYEFRPTNDFLFKSMAISLLARICLQKELILVSESFYRISKMSLESNIISMSEEVWKVVLSHYTFQRDETGKLQCPFEHCK